MPLRWNKIKQVWYLIVNLVGWLFFFKQRPSTVASQRTHYIIIKLLWRQNDVATSFWCDNDVIIVSCALWAGCWKVFFGQIGAMDKIIVIKTCISFTWIIGTIQLTNFTILSWVYIKRSKTPPDMENYLMNIKCRDVGRESRVVA